MSDDDDWYKDELIGELAALKERLEWQPIETAPKDKSILVFDGVIWIVHWFITNDRIYGWAASDHIVDHPTHWMPLPEPPK